MRCRTQIFVLGIFISLFSCSSLVRLGQNGPLVKRKDIEKGFRPILHFMDVRPGYTFADVGAASGNSTIAMSTLLENVKIYIEDIDSIHLKEKRLNRIINYYSRQCERDLRKQNQYFLIVGGVFHTNLPDNSFDVIHTNATIHVFQSPDSILQDMSRKLKTTGILFVRDEFRGDHGVGAFCSYPKCGRRLYSIDEFLALMTRNGFKLAKQSADVSGYPVFGFSKGNL